jgi:radical SAM/Cys-rich protein
VGFPYRLEKTTNEVPVNAFDEKIGGPLLAADMDILQVNVGLKCNQACTHCHLECSPAREEIMDLPTLQRVADLAKAVRPGLVDITGGAPELNPHLKVFITALTDMGLAVQARTNLSAMEEPGAEDYPEFFAEKGVSLVASMPCYLEENVDRMRGKRCYGSSIRMLKRLNALGYGMGDGLTLDLVFNPGGPDLPPAQECLEKDYKREMRERHGVLFDRLKSRAGTANTWTCWTAPSIRLRWTGSCAATRSTSVGTAGSTTVTSTRLCTSVRSRKHRIA